MKKRPSEVLAWLITCGTVNKKKAKLPFKQPEMMNKIQRSG